MANQQQYVNSFMKYMWTVSKQIYYKYGFLLLVKMKVNFEKLNHYYC